MKNAIFALSVIFNLLTFLSIFWLFFGGGFFKLIVQPNYEREVNQFSLLEVQSDDIVFIGDSLIQGGKWDELFLNSKIRNRGILGDNTKGVIERLGQVTKGKPSQIFLMIGINDLAMNTSYETIIGNILIIIEKIHNDSPGTQVFVHSVLPNKPRFKTKIELLNNELESAINGKAEWINIYPLFLDKEGVSMSANLSNDQAHLLGEGYLVWRDAIAHLVKKSRK